MRNLIIKFISIGWLALAATGAFGQQPDAKILNVTNPLQRIGIHIGDVIERRITIEVKPPYQLSRNGLPLKGANHNGIELTDLQVESSKMKQNSAYTITLRYQVFASAATPVVMQTPTEEFALTGGPQALSVKLPEWRFWYSPLVASGINHARENLQPQSKPELVAVLDHRHRLLISLGLCFAGLAGLIYLNADSRWLPFMNGPFAQANRKLKKLPENQTQAALLYLHQAFNQVYGANLFARDIPAFLAAHPGFFNLKAEIEAFFEQSNQALFANLPHDGEKLVSNLIVLAKNLRDCERGVS